MRPHPQNLLLLLLLSIVSMLAGGCSPEPAAPPGVTVIEWYTYATPEFLALYREELIPEFERLNPDIRIRLNASLGDTGYDAKLLTLVAGGIPPDVIHVTQVNFPFYAAKKLLIDVRKLAQGDPEFRLSDFFEPVMDGMTVDGAIYGLPSDFSTIVLFYNKDMFDAAGVPYPEITWTWETFLRSARALTPRTGRGTVPEHFAFVIQNAYNRWPAWVWMNGGDLFTQDLRRCRMDERAAMEGFRFYVELATRWNVAPASGQSTGQSPEELFIGEKVAMVANSRYAYKSFGKGLPFRWDVAPMPRGRKRATTLIWGGNCILRTTKHPEECWRFLKFLSGKEGAMGNVRMGNALPAYKPIALKPGVLRTQVTPPSDVEFIRAISHARAAPSPPQFADYTQALSMLDDAFLGIVTPEEACKRFAARVNQILKEQP